MAIKALFLLPKEGSNTLDSQAIKCRVQINPNTITVASGAQASTQNAGINEIQGVNKKAAEEPVVQSTGASIQTVSMQLHFDMVQMYRMAVKKQSAQNAMTKATTMISKFDSGNVMKSGMEGVTLLATPSDYTQISLLNKQYSCYSQLETAAKKQSPVVFFWGPMQYVGVLKSFSSKFLYFSNQGAPLRAEVTLTLACSGKNDDAEAAIKKEEAAQKIEKSRMLPPSV